MTREQGERRLSAAILAGGQSRRMGRDKALLEVRGRTLVERVAERLAAVADEVFVVSPPRAGYERFGLRIVPDRYPDAGSLGGIYTAVAEASHDYCLVVACDMPFLSVPLLTYMAERPRDYDVLVPSLAAERSRQGGRETLETLHAIYSKRCVDPMEARLREGNYKIIAFFDDVRVERLPEATVRRFDPDLWSFFNANTPEEFETALDRIEREGTQPRA